MNCDESKNLMIKKTYGKVTEAEQSGLAAHLRECKVCAHIQQHMEPIEPFLSESDKIPLPDWERSWNFIAERSLPKKRVRNFSWTFPKWVYAAVALVLVFGLGYLAGRRLLTSPKQALVTVSASGPQSPFLRYAEDLEPLLVGFLNKGDLAVPEEFSMLEKTLLTDMLQQTRVLKRLVYTQDRSHLQDMLDDLEFILIGISNLKSQDWVAAERLKSMIREKELKFKLKALAEPEMTF